MFASGTHPLFSPRHPGTAAVRGSKTRLWSTCVADVADLSGHRKGKVCPGVGSWGEIFLSRWASQTSVAYGGLAGRPACTCTPPADTGQTLVLFGSVRWGRSVDVPERPCAHNVLPPCRFHRLWLASSVDDRCVDVPSGERSHWKRCVAAHSPSRSSGSVAVVGDELCPG